MIKISEGEVKRLAGLSALEFTAEEEANFIPEFENILELISPVQNYPTDGEEPDLAIHKLANLREDVARPSLPQEEVLANAPSAKRGCFVVPQMLEE